MRIRIKHNYNEVGLILSGAVPKAVTQSVRRSVTRTFQGLRTQSSKTIKQARLLDNRQISSTEIKDRFMRQRKNTRGNNIADIYAELAFSDRRPSLAYFFAKQKNSTTKNRFTGKKLKGVQVRTFNRTYMPKGAFMQKFSSGKQIVFKRRGKKRTPIKKMWGPSLAIMLDRMGYAKQLSDYASDRYNKEFGSNLKFYMEKIRAKESRL